MKTELDKLIEERMKQKRKKVTYHQSLTLYVIVFLLVMLMILGSLWYFLSSKQKCYLLTEKDITAVNKAFNNGDLTEGEVEKAVAAYYDHSCFSEKTTLSIIKKYR